MDMKLIQDLYRVCDYLTYEDLKNVIKQLMSIQNIRERKMSKIKLSMPSKP